ncbi:MAG: hypothetical protein JF610_05000 [Acidobacteria bacterium]|nr:hypothetical protein [Acidobacteriota bacterium]
MGDTPTGGTGAGAPAPPVDVAPPPAAAPSGSAVGDGRVAACCNERSDPDVVVVQLLANDAHVVGEVVDHQLLIGECLPRRLGLLIEPRIDGLDGIVQRSEQVLQLLRLLLEDAQVGHQLLMFLVGGARRRRGEDDRGGEQAGENLLCHRLTLR